MADCGVSGEDSEPLRCGSEMASFMSPLFGDSCRRRGIGLSLIT